MPKYLTIKRLVESDELQQVTAPIGQIQSMDQFQAAQGAPAQEPAQPAQPAQQAEPMQLEVPEEPAQAEAPADQLALPSGEIMSMTIGDFLTKVEQVNPLVKMGLETFINSNTDQLMQVETPQPQQPEADLTFSNAIADQPEVSNFDQPEDQLAFPQ
jgi:hypothetical protein